VHVLDETKPAEAGPARAHVKHGADRAGLDPFENHAHAALVEGDVSDEHANASALRLIDDALRLVDVERHRFFDENVLAGRDRSERELRVRLRRCCDHDSLDRHLQQVGKARGRVRVRIRVPRLAEQGRIGVADRSEHAK